MTILHLNQDGQITDNNGRFFDVQKHAWEVTSAKDGADSQSQVTASYAVKWVVANKNGRKLPVGVIGPADPSEAEARDARDIGRGIAELGLPMICGGRGGAMLAASEGASRAGGQVIGILPSVDWLTANPFVTIPIATGIGEARNAIIACACFALISVGKGHGTLSEMALGLKMKRLVVTMPEAQKVDGAVACSNVETAIHAVATRYLGLVP